MQTTCPNSLPRRSVVSKLSAVMLVKGERDPLWWLVIMRERSPFPRGTALRSVFWLVLFPIMFHLPANRSRWHRDSR